MRFYSPATPRTRRQQRSARVGVRLGRCTRRTARRQVARAALPGAASARRRARRRRRPRAAHAQPRGRRRRQMWPHDPLHSRGGVKRARDRERADSTRVAASPSCRRPHTVATYASASRRLHSRISTMHRACSTSARWASTSPSASAEAVPRVRDARVRRLPARAARAHTHALPRLAGLRLPRRPPPSLLRLGPRDRLCSAPPPPPCPTQTGTRSPRGDAPAPEWHYHRREHTTTALCPRPLDNSRSPRALPPCRAPVPRHPGAPRRPASPRCRPERPPRGRRSRRCGRRLRTRTTTAHTRALRARLRPALRCARFGGGRRPAATRLSRRRRPLGAAPSPSPRAAAEALALACACARDLATSASSSALGRTGTAPRRRRWRRREPARAGCACGRRALQRLAALEEAEEELVRRDGAALVGGGRLRLR